MIHVASWALGQIIEKKRGYLDAMLAPYDLELGTVFDYETDTATIDDFPCIMQGMCREERSWVEAHGVLESRYEIPVMGYLGYDDNALNASAIKEFASAFMMAFEFKDVEEFEVPYDVYVAKWPAIEIPPQNLKLHYHYEVAMSTADIDYALVGDTLCRSFTTRWVGYMTRSVHWAFGQ